jgi:hypothetical protein
MICARLMLLLAVPLAGCATPRRQHPVIDRYRAAACLPVLAGSQPAAPSRQWDVVVRPSGGSEVRLSGYQAVNGAIVARDERTGRTHVVANAGDYVYPADVRASRDFRHVYVKAAGLAGGMWHETWLFEYDLGGYRQVGKVRVDPTVLPPECPAGASELVQGRSAAQR